MILLALLAQLAASSPATVDSRRPATAKSWSRWASGGAPTIADPDQSGPRFAVEKPLYAADGQTAEADLNFIFTGGPGDPLFLAVRHCALRKVSDHWRLI